MTGVSYQAIRENLRKLYLEDSRPWLVGFRGGKASTMVAALVTGNGWKEISHVSSSTLRL